MYYQILKSVLVYLQLVETKRKLLQMGATSITWTGTWDPGLWTQTLDPDLDLDAGPESWTLDPDPKKLDPENLDPEKLGP